MGARRDDEEQWLFVQGENGYFGYAGSEAADCGRDGRQVRLHGCCGYNVQARDSLEMPVRYWSNTGTCRDRRQLRAYERRLPLVGCGEAQQ